jgi:hypothetical protein
MLIALLEGCAVDHPKENKCTLDESHAPDIKGIHLGMTTNDLRMHYPELLDAKSDNYGRAGYSILATDNAFLLSGGTHSDQHSDGSVALILDASRYPDFKSISSIGFQTVDGHVSYIKLLYNKDVTWHSTDEFVKRLNEGLGIPDTWKEFGSNMRSMICDGVYLYAGLRNDVPHYVRGEGALADSVFDALEENGEAREHPFIIIFNDLYTKPRERMEMEKKDKAKREAEEEEQRRRNFTP